MPRLVLLCPHPDCAYFRQNIYVPSWAVNVPSALLCPQHHVALEATLNGITDVHMKLEVIEQNKTE